MSDESRFDANADREPLDEQTVTEDEPPPAVEFAADGGSADEDGEEASDEDPQQARERREGTGESIESDEDE